MIHNQTDPAPAPRERRFGPDQEFSEQEWQEWWTSTITQYKSAYEHRLTNLCQQLRDEWRVENPEDDNDIHQHAFGPNDWPEVSPESEAGKIDS